MAKRQLQEINAGSMADIAFLLLIFFLVTTTMDVSSGITRKLPPWEDNPDTEAPPVKERNVFIVLVNRNNDLLVEGEVMDITQLCDKTKEFIVNPRENENLSEHSEKEVDFLGMMRVSKGIVSLQNDRGTSYEKYIQVQNELTRAFNELREDLSKQRFGASYDDLSEEQQKAVRKVYPLSISEAEPRNVGK